MGYKIDLTGQKFGKLTVVSFFGTRNNMAHWNCVCDCGNHSIHNGAKMKMGHVKSCGCINKIKEHGMVHSQTYESWTGMKQRCNNPRNCNYKLYGLRGIKVCEEWNSFKNFLKDMGESPQGGSIERIDVNGDYCKSNCRWANVIDQANNKTNSIYLTYNNETKTLAQWSRLLGIKVCTIWRRINVHGWSVEKALTHKLRGS